MTKCYLGSCDSRAAVEVVFVTSPARSYQYCAYHGRDRNGQGPRWKSELVLDFRRCEAS